MDAWHFTEMPYPHLPPLDEITSMRVNLPNRLFDPNIGRDLYKRYLDEYVIADELGINIMLNEHHSSVSAMNPAAPLMASILARQTKNAKIVILGNPMANREDPIRIAEEMAVIDLISGGRLEVGCVRGVTFEIFAANTNPTQTNERLWEGVDMMIRAWTTHDGPFNYEGRFWHKRSINIWPRPFQQPRPRIWITGSNDLDNITKIAREGHVYATFLQPHDVVRKLFDLYRENYVSNGLPGGLAFMPFVYTAETDAEAMKGAEEFVWFLSSKTEPQFREPPGYVSVPFTVSAMKGQFGGRTGAMRGKGIEALLDTGALIAGSPDTVVRQIKRFYDLVGGFDHLLMMQQAGFMSHEKTVRSMTLFAKEVYPRIREFAPSPPALMRQAPRKAS